MLGQTRYGTFRTPIFNVSVHVNPWNDGTIGGEIYGIAVTMVCDDNGNSGQAEFELRMDIDETRLLAYRLLRAIGEHLPTNNGA